MEGDLLIVDGSLRIDLVLTNLFCSKKAIPPGITVCCWWGSWINCPAWVQH
ncbi:MAG: hypothetical protein H6645_05455 [Caldilineaceae bacterium]|nr:hypothetical protein [Caldilineaceae bacterium]